jgi:hypothetical protein
MRAQGETMTRRISLALAVLMLLLCGCSSRNVIEETTVNTNALKATEDYYVLPLDVTFKAPTAWEISNEEWNNWVDRWKIDFREELTTECFKTLHFIDKPEDAKGVTVSCTVYEMDKGGFSGFGGNGFARAHIVIKEADGKVLYDSKLEGTGGNSGFESAVAAGRLKFAILNLARQIAEVMERG